MKCSDYFLNILICTYSLSLRIMNHVRVLLKTYNNDHLFVLKIAMNVMIVIFFYVYQLITFYYKARGCK